MFQCLPRPLVIVVVTLSLDQYVDLLIGVDQSLNESLNEKSLNVVLDTQSDHLGHL